MIRKIIPYSVVLLVFGFSSLAFSDEKRNVAVDQAVGDMEQGRRISTQGSSSTQGIASGNSGSTGNPVVDTHAHHFVSTSGNRGYLYSPASQANGSQNGVNRTNDQQAGRAVNINVNNPSAASAGTSAATTETHTGTNGSGTATQEPSGTTSQTVTEHTNGSVNVNTGATAGAQAQGNGGVTGSGTSGSTTQEPSGTNNPIVAVEANPSSGTPTAGVTVDTSGQLEDRQIVSAGVAGGVTGSSGTQVGSASNITGSETVHGTNVTTEPVTGTTGQTVPATTTVQTQGNGGTLTGGATSPTEVTHTVTGSSGTTTQEPSGASGGSNPIVAVEANPSTGTPTAGVTVDTSGQLEERQIIDAGVTQEITGSSGAEVGSAADITEADLVEEADITAPTGTTTQEPSSGASSNPIVGVEAGMDQNSGTPNAGVSVDTTGELEDRQILQTDLAAEGLSSGTQTGSASGTTGSSTVHNTNVTTGSTGQTVTGTTGTQSGSSGTTTQEPSGTSNNPIVGVEAGTNSGSPNATVHVDTSGQIEDRQILGAGVTGQTTGSSETQIGSASGITGSETVGGLDVTTQPVESLIPAPSDFGAEIDTTGQTLGGAADVGLEADVSGVSEASDVGSEPAAGLPSGSTVHTGL